MELTKIVLVSLCVTAAVAVPYGHGVKGGASAKSGALAGALAIPGGGPGGFSGSGSFASASSFASSNAGSFTYGGSSPVSDGGSSVSGAAAKAAAFAGAGAITGSGGYGSGYSSDGASPCSNGNCQPADSQGCQGNNCGSNPEPEKCSSGACDSSSISSSGYSLPESDSVPKQNGPLLGHIALDTDDRPGKIELVSSVNGPNIGHYGSEPSLAPAKQGSLCTSPDCGQYSDSGPSCSSPGACGQQNASPCGSPGGCNQSGGTSSSAVAGSFAGATAGGYSGSPQPSGEVRTPILNSKPSYSFNSQYSGTFGGPPGILKPNDYSVPEKHVVSPQQSIPSYENAPHTQPIDVTPSIAPGPIYSGQSSYGPHKVKPQDISGLPPFPGSGSFAGTHSTSYTGGFGGPPGILRPNDFGSHASKPSSVPVPQGNNQIKPTYHETSSSRPLQDEKPYQGGFGGPPGIVRPNGPIGTGTFPNTQPKPDYTAKPTYSCSSNPESCGITQPALHPVEVVNKPYSPPHHDTPSSGCGAGGCATSNVNEVNSGCGPNGCSPSHINQPSYSFPSHSNEQNHGCGPQGCSQSHSEEPTQGCGPNGCSSTHSDEPKPSCGSEGCSGSIQYQGGFGGAPGIIRPTGPSYSGSYSSQQYYTPENYQPQTNPSVSSSYQGGYSASPSSGSPHGSTSGAFAGASASAAAGSYSGAGGPGVQSGYSHQDVPSSYHGGSGVQVGYSHQDAPSSYHGGYGVKGGYHGLKNSGLSSGCEGGCGEEGFSGAGSSSKAASGSLGLSFTGANSPFSAVKGVAQSLSQIGQNIGQDIGKNLGGILGLGGAASNAGALSISSAGAGSNAGALGVSGSYASAQASAGSKSYGGGF